MYRNILSNREEFFDEILTGGELKNVIFNLLLISFLLFGVYGFVMGINHSFMQAITSFVKVPLLFYLSLIICLPVMYVFNTFLGSFLTFAQTIALILTSFVISSSILISFAPVVVFFLLINSGYQFMILLHVGVFTVSGISGMIALRNSLEYACSQHNVYPKQGIKIFIVWVFIFAFVGTQLVWNLKPFIGDNNMAYELFRHSKGNFYLHTLKTTYEFLK